MGRVQFVDQTKKPEDFPNEVYFCFTNEGELQQTANASTVKYIRADIAVARETKLIEYAFDNGMRAVRDQIRYAEPPLFCPESDVEAVYYQSGLERLK